MDNEEQVLSASWRVTTSQVKPIELANLLVSANKMTAAIANASARTKFVAGQVPYATYLQSTSNAKTRELELTVSTQPIAKATTYPLPTEVVDTMLGQVVDSALANKLNSAVAINMAPHHASLPNSIYAKGYSSSALNSMAASAMRLATSLSHLGEELQVHKVAQQSPKLAAYHNLFTEFRKPTTPIDPQLDPVASAIESYRRVVLYKDATAIPTNPEVLGAFNAVASAMAGITSTAKYEARAAAYGQLASTLVKLLQNQDQPQQGDGQNQGKLKTSARKTASDFRDGKEKAAKKIAKKISETATKVAESLADSQDGDADEPSDVSAKDIEAAEKALDEEAQDATKIVAEMLAEQGQPDPDQQIRRTDQPMTVIANRPVDRILKPVPEYVAEFRHINQLRLDKTIVKIRRQDSGKLDGRKLYRYQTKPAIFHQHRVKRSKPKKLWLVVDVSDSMNDGYGSYGRMGDRMLDVCASVQAVIPDCRVYAYHSTMRSNEQDTCYIHRLDKGKETMHTNCSGCTPTSEGLAYVSYMLNRAGGGTILHLTDGCYNDGRSMTALLEANRKLGNVQILTAVICQDYMPEWTRLANENASMLASVLATDETQFASTILAELKKLWGV